MAAPAALLVRCRNDAYGTCLKTRPAGPQWLKLELWILGRTLTKIELDHACSDHIYLPKYVPNNVSKQLHALQMGHHSPLQRPEQRAEGGPPCHPVLRRRRGPARREPHVPAGASGVRRGRGASIRPTAPNRSNEELLLLQVTTLLFGPHFNLGKCVQGRS